MIWASMPGRPPLKHSASARVTAASVIGGSTTAFMSGQGRRSRPDVAVTFAASHRLSVSVIMATVAAAAGATATKASTTSATLSCDAPGALMIRNNPRRSVSVIVGASDPSVSRAAAVVRAAKLATQIRIRPRGYHSIGCGALGVAVFGVPAVIGRPSNARCPSHHAGSATVSTNAAQ